MNKLLGTVHKGRPQKGDGVCQERMFADVGEGVLGRCGRPHFLNKFCKLKSKTKYEFQQIIDIDVLERMRTSLMAKRAMMLSF